MLAKSPNATLYTEGFNNFLISIVALIATAWSDSCRVGFASSEDRRLSRRSEKFGLKAECVGELRDKKRSFPNVPCGASPLVVDEKDLTQRLVYEIEADVTFIFITRTVLLY